MYAIYLTTCRYLHMHTSLLLHNAYCAVTIPPDVHSRATTLCLTITLFLVFIRVNFQTSMTATQRNWRAAEVNLTYHVHSLRHRLPNADSVINKSSYFYKNTSVRNVLNIKLKFKRNWYNTLKEYRLISLEAVVIPFLWTRFAISVGKAAFFICTLHKTMWLALRLVLL